jgi:4-hydroxy-L-threonine phosphate dehydrogenase PdxA
MSQYNRLRLAENLHAEVTDQSVYLAHEDSQWATALDHDQFEELTEFYEDVRDDVQSRNRMRVMVYNSDGDPVEYAHTQSDNASAVVEEFQRAFSDDHEIEVKSL